MVTVNENARVFLVDFGLSERFIADDADGDAPINMTHA